MEGEGHGARRTFLKKNPSLGITHAQEPKEFPVWTGSPNLRSAAPATKKNVWGSPEDALRRNTDKTSLQADREDWGMGGGGGNERKRKERKRKGKDGKGKERKGKGKGKERSGRVWSGLVLVWSGLVWSGLVWSGLV